MKRRKSLKTYAQAGVSISSAGQFIRAIGPLAARTHRQGAVRGIGGFGGLFEMPSALREGQLLVASADGVGTKLILARRLRRYAPLGVDLVAMNVNDILCAGAAPLFFLDYIACGKLKPHVFSEIIRGVARGCVESDCVLLGGETAQMPLVYGADDFDLAGFAVGAVKKKDLVTGHKIRPGDLLLGLASSGPHANGFTLIQTVLSGRRLARLGPALLAPTRIYVQPVLQLLKNRFPVRGIAHITGGSFREKLPRILPKGTAALLYRKRWKVPAIFAEIEAAGVSREEMYRTFNMGIGMILVMPAASISRAQQALDRFRIAGTVIGEVVKGGREILWG